MAPPCVYTRPAELDEFFNGQAVQVWDLFLGPKLAHLAVQKFVQFRRSRVNPRWNRAKICPDPFKRGLKLPTIHFPEGGRLIEVDLTFSFATLTHGLSQSVVWVYKSNSQRKNRTDWKMRSELEINLMILRPVKKIFSSITSLCFTDCLHWNLVTI